jgi:hypothetical protein
LRRVEQLESRSRVSAAAGSKFGMRLPAGDELVILPLHGMVPPRLAGASRPPVGEGG